MAVLPIRALRFLRRGGGCETRTCSPVASPPLLFTQIRSNQKRLSRCSIPKLSADSWWVEVDVRLEWRLDLVSRTDRYAPFASTLRFVCSFAAFDFLG